MRFGRSFKLQRHFGGLKTQAFEIEILKMMKKQNQKHVNL